LLAASGDLKLGNILLKSTATDLRGAHACLLLLLMLFPAAALGESPQVAGWQAGRLQSKLHPGVAGFIAKICDFGMSRLMDASKTHVSTSSMGTISYQPPELLLGQGACQHEGPVWQTVRRPKHMNICTLGSADVLKTTIFQYTAIGSGTISCWACHSLICCFRPAGLSKACDVYAFGVGVHHWRTLLAVHTWLATFLAYPSTAASPNPFYTHRLCLQIIMFELFAGEVAFQGANLGHLIFQIGELPSCAPAAVIVKYCTILSRFITIPFFRRQSIIVRDAVHKRERPPIPADCPADYTDLMQRCWQNDAALRPTFKDVLASLQAQFCVLRAARPKRVPATPGPPAAPAASPAAGSKAC
jgi:serine/threonine protein kinase